MQILWLAPFFLQAVVIGFDEFFFHVKRGLPKWERIGHPMDTLTLIASMLFIFFVEKSADAMKNYILLAVLSCLMVTKDEFVHAEVCPKQEHLLHAFLFILHPTVLIAAATIWQEIHAYSLLRYSFGLYIASMVAFCLYQIIYWNYLWKEERAR